MLPTATRTAKFAAAISVALASLALAGPALATPASGSGHAPTGHPSSFRAKVVINGAKLSHTFVPAGPSTRMTEPLTKPDDITVLGNHIFTAFQNGVGPQGQPSTADGNTDSTVVEFTPSGRVIHQWDLHGKCDGITADSQLGVLIATVNEDANSSIYTIRPGAPKGAQITHYRYNRNPLPHNGGTDAISVYGGLVLISASAPGTAGNPAPQPNYPAVYSVAFNSVKHVAHVTPLFYDEATAAVANVGPIWASLSSLHSPTRTRTRSCQLRPAGSQATSC